MRTIWDFVTILKRVSTLTRNIKKESLCKASMTLLLVVAHLCALGAHLGHGPPQPKETERFSKAKDCAAKVRAAPVSASVRAFVASSAAAMKAAYGWLVRRPIRKLRSPLDSMLKKAGFNHHMAAKSLVRLVLGGHCLDINFYSGMLDTNSGIGTHWRCS